MSYRARPSFVIECDSAADSEDPGRRTGESQCSHAITVTAPTITMARRAAVDAGWSHRVSARSRRSGPAPTEDFCPRHTSPGWKAAFLREEARRDEQPTVKRPRGFAAQAEARGFTRASATLEPVDKNFDTSADLPTIRSVRRQRFTEPDGRKGELVVEARVEWDEEGGGGGDQA